MQLWIHVRSSYAPYSNCWWNSYVPQAVRSNVFKCMLDSDECKTSVENTITIPDLTYEELKALLEFFYSGSLSPANKPGPTLCMCLECICIGSNINFEFFGVFRLIKRSKIFVFHIFSYTKRSKFYNSYNSKAHLFFSNSGSCLLLDRACNKHARVLYLAAHKYDIPYLQELCRDQFISSSNLSNVLDILELSSVPSDKILKEAAIRFIVMHMETIVNCDRYKSVVRKDLN